MKTKVAHYRVMGLHGPIGVATAVADRVQVVAGAPWDFYGHSSCWEDDNFDRTMRGFASVV